MRRLMNYLYQHWASMCLPLAFYITLLLCSSLNSLPWVVFLIWLQFPVYLLHEFEEHAYPGGFKHFVNKEVFRVFDRDFPLNDQNIFWINIPAIWILFPLCAVLAQNADLRIGAILPMFGLFNASLHMIMAAVKLKYNPGLFVSTVLNYPTGIYTLWVMYQFEALTIGAFFYAFLIALAVHALMVLYAVTRFQR